MASRPWPQLRPSTPAWDRFALALVEDGPTPCAGRDEWTDDEPGPRAEAVEACRPCPLLDLCRDAAESTGEAWGVYAGQDRGPRLGRPPTTDEESAA